MPDDAELALVAEGLQRALSKLWLVMRHTGRTPLTGELTLSQLSILLTLIAHGPLKMTELAACEGVRTPTTTVAIRRLEKLGLVRRLRLSSDLRVIQVEITQAGLAQHEEALAVRREHLSALLGRLTEEELDALRGALTPLERLAER